MSKKAKTPKADDADELARRAMVAAARFAGSAMARYNESYPAEAAALAGTGCNFAVRVSDILSATPKVALLAVIDRQEVRGSTFSQEIEIACANLAVAKKPDVGGMH